MTNTPPTDDDPGRGTPTTDDGTGEGDPGTGPLTSRRAVLGAAAGGTLAGAFGDDAIRIGRDLLGDDRTVTPEERGQAHLPALDLVPPEDATHVATESGDWTDPSTWDGTGVPDDGARVHVEETVSVRVAERLNDRLRSVRVDGELRFDPTTDTAMRVGTLVTATTGILRIGTEDRPVDPSATANVTFADLGPIDVSTDPERVGRGLVAMGRTEMVGAERTPWTRLAAFPTAGDETLSLPEAPTNWASGDRLVVPGTNPEANEDEELLVESVDGSDVHLDRPLSHDHVPPADDLDAYVVHLDRNVRLTAENEAIDRRGHLMFTSRNVDLRWVGTYGLGRTEKTRPFTNPLYGKPPEDVPPNPRARYAIHFHRVGVSTDRRAAVVEGCVVDDSPGWGVVNHASYVDVTDSVTHDVVGAGFVAEAGHEVGSFRGNFALRSEGSGEFPDSRRYRGEDGDPGQIDDFGHGGHGFWLQSPGVAVEDNVAAGHRHHAFAFWNRALVDRELRPGEEVGNLRGEVANFPLENVEGQAPLRESEEVHDGKVPSSYVRLRSVSDNVAFASGGGLNLTRIQFGWEHGRFSEWNTVSGFTAYDLGPFVTHWGKAVDPDARGGDGGSNGVSIQYSHNVHFDELRLIGDGEGAGINRNRPYPRHLLVEGAEITGFDRGVRALPRGMTVVRDSRLANATNVSVPRGHRSATGQRVWLDGVTFEDGADANVDVHTGAGHGSLHGLFSPRGGIRIDDSAAYGPQRAPDHVPIPDRETLDAYDDHGFADLADGDVSAEDLIGRSNSDLASAYGLAVGGSTTPDSAVNDDRVDGGWIEDPDVAREREVALEAEDGDLAAPLDVASDPDASGETFVVARGVESGGEPPEAGRGTYEFDVPTGEYRVHARAHAPSGDADSYWIRVDDGDWTNWNGIGDRRGWEWDRMPGEDGPATLSLSGSHRLQIAFREDDTELDRLVVIGTDAPVVGRGPEWGEPEN
jgi:hypothetical protein